MRSLARLLTHCPVTFVDLLCAANGKANTMQRREKVQCIDLRFGCESEPCAESLEEKVVLCRRRRRRVGAMSPLHSRSHTYRLRSSDYARMDRERHKRDSLNKGINNIP